MRLEQFGRKGLLTLCLLSDRQYGAIEKMIRGAFEKHFGKTGTVALSIYDSTYLSIQVGDDVFSTRIASRIKHFREYIESAIVDVCPDFPKSGDSISKSLIVNDHTRQFLESRIAEIATRPVERKKNKAHRKNRIRP